ncbi:MAG: Xaa-Pro peptidase family protein [Planctomycetota bacterium]|nr:Xaa-Pro peptidase family protein [Planctomycetota bacterium]
MSTTSTDWQERVNFDRLRNNRLHRALEKMQEHDMDALILFVGENVRYVTGVFQGNWKNNIFIRYAVLPRGGKPVLFETAGSDMECAKIDAPWLDGRIRPAITWKWSEGAEDMMVKRMVDSIVDVLKEHGCEKGKIGIDIMDMQAYNTLTAAGLNIVNAWPVMSGARVIKTPDEIELLKISSAFGDACFDKIKYDWLKPGVREADITAKVNEYLYANGFDFVYDIIVASGGNTSPYRRWHTDKIIRRGDMVIIDINAVGPGGYFVDFVRCMCVGDKPSQQLKDLYKECYDSLYAGIEQIKPGATTADVVSKFPVYDDDKYGTVTLQQFGHSIGLSLYEGMWMSRAYSLDYPAEIKQNMYFAVETFAGHPKLQQTTRLEENLVVTDKGYQCFTLFPFEQSMLS